MFKRPTKRSRRYTWHDAAMPLSAPAPVATSTSYAATPNAADDDPCDDPCGGEGISTLTDEERTVTLTLPPNWDQHDIAMLMQAMVEQNNQRMYFGQVEPTPRHLGELDPSEDQSPVYETQLDAEPDDPKPIKVENVWGTSQTLRKPPTQKTTRPPGAGAYSAAELKGHAVGNLRKGIGSPNNIARYQERKARGEVDAASVSDDDDPRNIAPTLDPNSVTRGGTAGPGMLREHLMSVPLRGVEDVVWARTDQDGFHVLRRNTNDPMKTELLKTYPVSKDSTYHFDQTATHFRVFRLSRYKPMDLTNPSATSDGAAYGTLKARFAGDRAAKIRAMNEAHRQAWGGK